MEEYRARLTESEHESATWKRKYNEAMLEMETMSGQLEQKDCEILKQRRQMIERDELLLVKDKFLDRYVNKKKRMDFFSDAHSDSDDPPAEKAWVTSGIVACFLVFLYTLGFILGLVC